MDDKWRISFARVGGRTGITATDIINAIARAVSQPITVTINDLSANDGEVHGASVLVTSDGVEVLGESVSPNPDAVVTIRPEVIEYDGPRAPGQAVWAARA